MFYVRVSVPCGTLTIPPPHIVPILFYDLHDHWNFERLHINASTSF